jgi:hypothetical protein
VTRDADRPPAATRSVAAVIPGARYITLDGQDHGVLMQPDTLHPVLTDYSTADGD